jgi:abhydrolase domain-containing protein 6
MKHTVIPSGARDLGGRRTQNKPIRPTRTTRPLLTVAITLALLALIAFAYLRPLTLFYAARRVYLGAIGMKSDYVQVGPHRVHYWTGGEGPPLLFVHGVAMRAADLAPLFRALEQHHRVYAPDLLGFGDTDAPPGSDYSITTQAALVRGFMDAMHLQQPDVVGLSMGGWISLTVAGEHPERVRRLVLLSSPGLAYESLVTENTFAATTIAELRRSFALQSDLLPRLPTFIVRDVLRVSEAHRAIVRASMRAMFTRRDLLLDHRLQRVHMPVLIVAGTNDRIVPFDVARRLHAELPQSKLVPLEGCGHLAAFECRGATLRAVLAFLRQP